jgi:hypothetical protein
MFGDLRLAETQAADQVPDRARPIAQEFDNVQPVGFGERSERCHHGESEYAPRRIFLSSHIPVEEYIPAILRGRRETPQVTTLNYGSFGEKSVITR